MTINNLDNLIDKLYKDGIGKVKKEAEDIINIAKKEAENNLKNAKKESEAIIAKAKQEAEQIVSRSKKEMQNSYNDILLSLKEKISSLITYKTFNQKNVKDAIDTKEFIKNSLLVLLKDWGKDQDLDVYFSNLNKKTVEEILNTESKSLTAGGLDIKFKADDKSGFTVKDKADTFEIIFNEETLTNLFVEKLKPFVKDVLFGEK